jgi:plasmid stability protein
MTNLTITVDDEVLKRARIKALEQGTSVNAVLREFYSASQQSASSLPAGEAEEAAMMLGRRAGAGSSRPPSGTPSS